MPSEFSDGILNLPCGLGALSGFYMQAHVDIAAGGVGIGANLVGGFNQLLRLLGAEPLGAHGDVGIELVAAFGGLADADGH